MTLTDRSLAYSLLRIAFGIDFLGHGFFRILSGVHAFASGMADHLTKSPLPHGFTYGFGLLIPWIELLLGIALTLGLATRWALVGGAAFMWALLVGVTSNQQWDVAGQQLVYSVIFFLLLYLIEHNGLSVDRLLATRRPA